jgi:hypothetical protein
LLTDEHGLTRIFLLGGFLQQRLRFPANFREWDREFEKKLKKPLDLFQISALLFSNL